MADALREPLLRKAQARTKESEPFSESSHASAVLLLCSSAIGTGVLALPYGVSCVGVLPAISLFALAGVASYTSNCILFRCVKETNINSYGELMALIFGASSATVLDAFVCVEGVGAVATYLVFIMDYVPQICALGGDDLWCTDRANVAKVASSIIWPLSCFKGLYVLQYVSTCSIVTICFTSVVVVFKAPAQFGVLGRPFIEAITEMHFTRSAFQVLSMACFAFMVHSNTPEIASQLLPVSRKTIRSVVGLHTLVLWMVYCILAVCGFLSFLNTINQDFLTNYPVHDWCVLLCRTMLSVTLVFACPINLFPAMQALFNILERFRGGAKKSSSLYDNHVTRIPVTTASFAIALGIAFKSPHVADLISLISAYLTAPLMFMFPAIMFCKILKETDRIVPFALIFLTVALWVAETLRLLGSVD